MRRFLPTLLAALVALPLLALPATAYPGGPWFEPSKTYDQNFPDPSIVRDGATYYAFGTSTGGAYLPVMTSTDHTTWTARPKYDPGPPENSDPFFNDAFPRPPAWIYDRPVSGRLTKEIWAPGAAKVGNHWVVWYSARKRPEPNGYFCLSVATSNDPLGPYVDNSTDCANLRQPSDPRGWIDPQPFVDSDGTPYLIFKGEGIPGSTPTRIWSAHLDPSGTSLTSDPVEILRTSQPWEGNVIENPAMVRTSTGRLELFYSANEWHSTDGSARYATGYADCSSPSGPCVKWGGNPVLANRGDHLSPGGPSPFLDDTGKLWLAYHWWNAPYTDYPSNPNCDGNGTCTSQGQRRMAVEPVYFINGDHYQVGGTPPLQAVAHDIDESCPPGKVPSKGYTDVPAGSTHARSIDCIAWWSITNTQGQYQPSALVTRGQMASFIARMIDDTDKPLPPAATDHFGDDNGNPHEANINRLADAGIVGGRADGTYGPFDPVSRAQMATFIVRAYERVGGTLPTGPDYFPDDNGNTHEANINKAAKAGFTGGRPDGTYDPSGNVQRDQMASFIARVLDLLVEQQHATTP